MKCEKSEQRNARSLVDDDAATQSPFLDCNQTSVSHQSTFSTMKVSGRPYRLCFEAPYGEGVNGTSLDNNKQQQVTIP